MANSITGRCFCGSVRFAMSQPPIYTCHCHCESCQRASGAPYMTWVEFPARSFEVTQGRLAERQSSPGVTRGHCAACGSAITYAHVDRPDEIDIAATCLDDPAIVEPQAHIWLADRQPWVEIADELPQYVGGPSGPTYDRG